MQESVRAKFRPITYSTAQVSTERFVMESYDKSVRIKEVHGGITPGSHLIKGYVESEGHGGTYFEVKMRLSKGNDIAESRCTCTSSHFYGNPCSHALTMRNVYVKHKKELKKEVRK